MKIKLKQMARNLVRLEIYDIRRELVLYVSYETVVAFAAKSATKQGVNQSPMVVCQASGFSKSTRKHLNIIDGGLPDAKKRRKSFAEFNALLKVALD